MVMDRSSQEHLMCGKAIHMRCPQVCSVRTTCHHVTELLETHTCHTQKALHLVFVCVCIGGWCAQLRWGCAECQLCV